MTSASFAPTTASPDTTLDAPARRPMEETLSGGDGLTTGNVKPPAPPTGPAVEPGDPPVLTVAAVVVGEGEGFVDLVFTLSAAATQTATVGWQLADPAGDLGLTSGSVSFAAGALTQTVRIPITSDGVQERFESFVVSLANPVQLTLASTSTLITLVDDDAASGTPVISARDVQVDESAGTASFVVVLDRPSASAVTVNYATASGTAASGSDFTARSGTLSFAAGEVAKTVSVDLVDDSLAEAAERFDLVLSSPVGGSLGDARGTAQIGASDAAVAATPELRVGDQRVSEADGWVDVLVTLSAPAAAAVSVGWATVAGTALAGSDFIASTGTLQLQPGQTSATVRLGLLDDTATESFEDFSLNLSSPVNATLADASASIAIVDNDTPGVRVLSYGIGSDTYQVLSTSDVIVEAAGGGTDLVQASASYTLGDQVERLTLTGSAGLSGTGNGLSNSITGNSGSNLLVGGSGNDTLSGGSGNDSLDGGSGNDSLVGGAGNDSYVVGSSTDRINETTTSASEIDSVTASLSWTLGANLETLVLTGTGALAGTGNAAANRITGNTGNNSLSGAGGNDTLSGGEGNDTLAGDAGNDLLDGGAGNDSLVGGAGNDSYVVGSAGDVVSETSTLAGEVDSVSAALTWTLGSNLERLTLTGTSAINGTGNTLANSITGNSAANSLSGGAGNDTLSGGSGNDRLDGGAGNDSLVGGTGNDSYVVDVVGDRISETSTMAGEVDSVSSSVSWTLGNHLERLTLTGTNAINGTGNTLANTLTGNTGNNSLDGGAGNDTLNGGAGNDALTGGTGLDTFRFSSALSGSNVDSVNAFVAADDRIELENSVYTKLTATGLLSASFFRANTSGTAADSNDYLIYETDTGFLRYDADGSGAGVAVLVARFVGAPSLTAADIFVT
jgi:Ca2+-binding RTX toxin-like protein